MPIEVPPFHGIAPQLSLVYNSMAQNGQLGVGWRLSGFGKIVAVGPKKGALQADKPVTYLLDGEELVPCSAQTFNDDLGNHMSPSCQSARVAFASELDFYSTRTERSVRVRRTATGWTVARMDGSVGTYESLPGHPAEMVSGVRIWGLRYVDDSKGNRVTYNWSRSDYEGYPFSIEYTGTVIKLYIEPRPDPLSSADGVGLWATSYRLKTVQVLVGSPATQTARVYALTYGPTRSTSRSIISSIDVFGSDATVDTLGTVTNALSALRQPRVSFEYTPEPDLAFTTDFVWSDYVSDVGGYDGRHLNLDFNGDGKQDQVWSYVNRASGLWGVDFWGSGTGGSLYDAGFAKTGAWSPITRPMYSALDLDGDGRADLCLLDVANGSASTAWKIKCVRSNRDSTFTFLANQTFAMNYGPGVDDRARVLTGDLDGDSDTDLCVDHISSTSHDFYCALNSGSGVFTSIGRVAAGSRRWPDEHSFHLMDITGDRISDLCFEGPVGTSWAISCQRGRGDGSFDTGITQTFAAPAFAAFWGGGTTVGDFNGDGLTEMCRSIARSEGWTVGCVLADGYGEPNQPGFGFFAGNLVASKVFVNDANGYDDAVLPGDFNGDGNTDLCAVFTGYDGVNYKWGSICTLGNGRGGFLPAVHVNHAIGGMWFSGSAKLAGDFDGDGLTDLAAGHYTVGGTSLPIPPLATIHRVINVWREPVLLTRESNGIGGQVTVNYRPSSAWANKNNPAVMHTVRSLVTFDGTRSWDTAFEYSGGEVHRGERRFLGFEYMYEYPPLIAGEAVRPRNVTRFSQALTALGRPLETWRQRWNGFAYQSMTYTLFSYHHSPTGAIPYTSHLLDRIDYLYDDAGNYIATIKGFTYDNLRLVLTGNRPPMLIWAWGTGISSLAGYGVPTTVTDNGNAFLSGDEDRTSLSYAPNDAKFLVKPYRILRQAEATVVSDTYMYYDLPIDTPFFPLPDPKTPPARGLLTHRLDWLDSTAAYVPTQRLEYDSFGNVKRTRDARGYDTLFTIDPTYNLLVVATTNALGHTASAPLADWVLRCNAPGRVVDPNGVATQTSFDALCRPLVRTTRDPQGIAVAAQWFDYRDSLRGQVTAQYVESFTPSADGITDQFARSYYDGLGRVYRTESKGPSAAQTIRQDRVLDDRGHVWKTHAPYFANAAPPAPTEQRYDALDRQLETILPDGNRATVAYALRFDPQVGAIRWLDVTRTDAGMHVSVESFNARGQVEWRGEDVGATLAWTEHAYTAAGRLRSTRDPNGNLTEYTYDTLGRTTQHNDPDRGIWDFGYDSTGNLLTTWQSNIIPGGARQQVSFGAHDALGRPSSKTAYSASGAQTTWFHYDQARPGFYNIGKLTTARDNCDLGTCAHSPFVTGSAMSSTCSAMANRVCLQDPYCCTTFWDGACVSRTQSWTSVCAPDNRPDRSTVYLDYTATGQLAWRHQSVDEKSFLFRYTYDLGGRLKRLIFPEGDALGTIAYDGAGRVKAIPGFTDTQYNALGQVTRQETAQTTPTITTLAYHPVRHWLTGITTTSGVTTLQQLGLAHRDAEGKLLSLTSPFFSEGWSSFAYSDQHQLTQATSALSSSNSQTFAYNPIGNITSNARMGAAPACAAPGENYCYGTTPFKPHAVSSAGSTAYGYDPNGNMIASGGQLRTYDGENRLVQTSDPTWLLRFAYDALGGRSKKVENGSRTLYVGDDYEVAPNGNTTRYISLGGRLVAKSVRYASGTTEKFWIHTDHLGSVNVITNSFGGQDGRWVYRPYGELLGRAGAHPESRTYTGQRQDAGGLYYLHARYYDPKLARFISADPIIPSSALIGLNRYAYAGNNPTNYTDTNGMAFDFREFGGDIKQAFSRMADRWDRATDPLWKAGGWVEDRLGLSGQEWYEEWGRDFAGDLVLASVVVGLTVASGGTFGGALAAIGSVAGGAAVAAGAMATAATLVGYAQTGELSWSTFGRTFLGGFHTNFRVGASLLAAGVVGADIAELASNGGLRGVEEVGGNGLNGYVVSRNVIATPGGLTIGSATVYSGGSDMRSIFEIHEFGHTLQFITLSGVSGMHQQYAQKETWGFYLGLGLVGAVFPNFVWEDIATGLGG